MNKKLFLPVLAIAALIPMMAFGMYSEDANQIGKEFAANKQGLTILISTSEAEISEKEEVDRAELIVEGKIINVKSHWKVIHEDTDPQIFTDFEILVSDVIKGEKVKVVKVTMVGGFLDEVTVKNHDAPHLEKGDQVIMLLGKDTSSIFGESYHPISVSKSTYVIEDDIAQNKHDDRSDNKNKVKEKLTKLAQR